MNNPASNNNSPESLSFSPFVSSSGLGGEDSILKTKLLRLQAKALRLAVRVMERVQGKIATGSLIKRRVVNPSCLDIYGRPRVLSGWEAIIHVLAWPAVIGVVIGFALAISLVVIHTPSPLQTQPKSNSSQVALLLETES